MLKLWLAIVLVSFTSCSLSANSTAKAFLKATYSLNYSKASHYASDEALMQIALMEGRLEDNTNNTNNARSFYQTQKITIIETTKNKDGTATVKYKATEASGKSEENLLYLRKNGLVYRVYAMQKAIAPSVSYFFKKE